jgi:hypothetical protein
VNKKELAAWLMSEWNTEDLLKSELEDLIYPSLNIDDDCNKKESLLLAISHRLITTDDVSYYHDVMIDECIEIMKTFGLSFPDSKQLKRTNQAGYTQSLLDFIDKKLANGQWIRHESNFYLNN